MNKIYTKKGDGGNTKTFHGPISKSDQLAIALGTIDELNSWLGICGQDKELHRIQTNLMTINSILAGAKAQRFRGTETTHLEKLIDKLTKDLPELKNFIYPVGFLQVARTVCRRAERELVLLNTSSYRLTPSILKYINRLSDALFTMARSKNRQAGIAEVTWN